MYTLWVVAVIAVWGVVLLLGFLLLGALRVLGLLSWRLEQLEATTPRRIGRSGLKAGVQAPDFTLKSTDGVEVSLHDFVGRKLLLVFVQTGCNSCQTIVPELNRLHRKGDLQVLVINNAGQEDARNWAKEVRACFPVLIQEEWSTARRYEVYSAPFSFLIDEQGTIASKGIINHNRHIGFVLAGAGDRLQNEQLTPEPAAIQIGDS